MIQAERILRREIKLMLQLEAPNCVIVPVPNIIPFPRSTPAQRVMMARVINNMKDDFELLPGAFDLVCLWDTGSGVVELKRPASKTLLGKRRAGAPSDDQKEFAAQCEAR